MKLLRFFLGLSMLFVPLLAVAFYLIAQVYDVKMIIVDAVLGLAIVAYIGLAVVLMVTGAED